MKRGANAKYCIVLVTVPNKAVGRRLAGQCLKERLTACVNLVPGLESHYWWQGRLDAGREVLMLIKTRERLLGALEKLILQHHPYETPEFVVLRITGGNAKYLQWIMSETSAG